MRWLFFPALVSLAGFTAQAQSSSSYSEDLVEISPFSIEGEVYRPSSYLDRRGEAMVDPKSASTPAAVAVSIQKRADAVAVQFVLSHAGDKQEVRNHELYASVEAVDAAFRKVPGTRVEQREVRFTGGDRKLFSLGRGSSSTSFASVLVLAELPEGSRVAERVKQIRDVLAATRLVGQTKYNDGAVGLYLRNPEQYRREILEKIFQDVEFMKKGFGPEFEVLPSGLNGRVRVRAAAEADLELWIDYSFTFRSIRELEAAKHR